MRYIQFKRKMDLKLALERQVHGSSPTEKRSLLRAANCLDDELRKDPEYASKLREYEYKKGRS